MSNSNIPSDEEKNEIAKMLQFVPQVAEIFDVKEKVGEGTFSNVFRAVVKKGSKEQEYALKYLIPTSKPSRIASELQCLKEFGGSNNIVGVEFCIMNNGHVVIVMSYYPHQRFSEYVRLMKISDIKDYMRNLLIALCKIHSHGVIHRDIKPSNFLYNQTNKSYTLVDFGLAQRVSDLQSSKYSAARQPLSDSSGRLNKKIGSTSAVSLNSDKRSHESLPASVSGNRYQIENVSKRRKLSPTESAVANEILPAMNNHVNSTVNQPKNHQVHSKARDSTKYAKNNKSKDCGCFRKPTVCKICLGRDQEEAPRAGTPGFRAPEVLLKHKQQSTAIDMWSAGVILLSILSKKYPFFKADDDITALAEITFLVGTQEMKEAANSLGKILTMNLPETTESISNIRRTLTPARYLQALCTMIQQEQPCQVHNGSSENESSCVYCYENSRQIPESAFDLLDRLLDPNPFSRITAADALCHPFIAS
ncbi:cell division cycle 7-related protein kinase-like [Uloborus diversus]|uniref:cell division cycle 7-related protein kinase-like n=1 Tax=Uloborus diversus TaxID=327109 RepID=UPI00240A95F0|nr:cell division cycle 7-related protein kinase-like [Uloborus diversus]